MMLTPDQAAEMLAAGEMFPKGFVVWHSAWLAAHDKEVLDKAVERVRQLHYHCVCTSFTIYELAIRGEGEQDA
jgi:hypothetical protein